jgi:Flp pilus assembly protein TadG
MQFKLRKKGAPANQPPGSGGRASEKGAVQVEFALVALTLFLVIFAIVELERMLLVYTTLANSTRAAVRYAIVHGNDRSGTGVNGPSTSGSHSNVDAVVTTLASAGALNASNLTVTVTYTPCSGCGGTSNSPGSTVSVQAVYAYDPFTALPLNVNLSSVSKGIITF